VVESDDDDEATVEGVADPVDPTAGNGAVTAD
jgi:hypothetical protein